MAASNHARISSRCSGGFSVSLMMSLSSCAAMTLTIRPSSSAIVYLLAQRRRLSPYMHLSPAAKDAAISLLDEAASQISGDILETEIALREKRSPGAEKTRGLESLRFPSRFQTPLLARSTGLEPEASACLLRARC
ncbi:Phage integrase family protein [Stigmatella aurantiaca DW4/3-1]|uniref:Phage integrase family protein n=1 Tax=Stigmatella aurantiaca (strain DW4/3-1) TaxID=378806 RepID=E3FPW8_STIAD|nr:Phage integrase family protein [Stigmatella aurantiaca DW4/3-1]